MTINLQKPDITELKPKITVFGVGGGGGNAVNNMINGGLEGVEFVVANTDAQALTMSAAEKIIQLGTDVTEGLGAGSMPEVGAAAAEECMTEIQDYLNGTHMAFVTAGMGGGTGTGAAPVVARAAREMGVLTVGVVTKPFQFEGQRRMKTADAGIAELQKHVDTLIVIPNQNLFRIANDKTTFSDAFGMADQVLYSGVACITDLMVKEGLINLDFADVRSVMRDMGKAMMGTGEAGGEGRARLAAEAAISNPLLDETTMSGAQGLLISITGGRDMTLFEVDEAATRISEEVDESANIIVGATFDENLEGVIRVSVVATGIDAVARKSEEPVSQKTIDAVTRALPKANPVAKPAATAAEKQDKTEEFTQKIEKTAAAMALPRASEPAQKERVERDGVGIAPFKPEAKVFSDPKVEDEFKSALEEELLPEESNFVPPAAEEPRGVVQATAIPKVEDFPPMVQQAVAEKSEPSAPQAIKADTSHGPMGLLNKLKHSFSGREHEMAASGQPQQSPRSVAPSAPVSVEHAAPQPVAQAPMQPAPQTPPQTVAQNAPQQPVSAPAARVDDNPYAPKRGQLDTMGRINPVDSQPTEEDQLDIPAFLRRQAN